MERFGEILKARRLELGLSLDQVEAETKIRKFYINALENNDFKHLPAQVYAVGFVKQYSRLLQLDENEMIQRFKLNAYRDEGPDLEMELPKKVVRKNISIPFKNIIAGIIFLLAAIWLGSEFVDYITPNQPPAQESPVPSANLPETEVNQTETEGKQPESVEGVHLVLKAQGTCWVGYNVDGGLQQQFMIRAGETRNIDAGEKIHLVLGNPGVVTIEYNGKDLGVMGDPKKVLRIDFPLEAGAN